MDRSIVSSLIECEKIITIKPKKNMSPDPKSSYVLRNEFSCESLNGDKRFSVFMKKNIKLRHMFSIGLRYHSPEGTFILCRYNGSHAHKNKIADHNRFESYHIHCLYDQQLSDTNNICLDADPTTRYMSFEGALCLFLQDCHIQSWQQYFPDLPVLNQMIISEFLGGERHD